MKFLPEFPIHTNPTFLLGMLVIFGLLGGEIAKFSRFIPKIFGYIAVGFLVGPHGFNLIGQSFVTDAHIFVEISLGLILYELGRHFDIKWLQHDRSLLCMSLAESILTFTFIFGVLHFLGLSYIVAVLAATMAVVTSPAVVLMVTHDLSSQGPVTRRTLMLTSMNNLFGLILFALFLPFTQPEPVSSMEVFIHSCYRLMGSIGLGLVMFYLTMFIAWIIGKQKESQFILFVSVVLLTISLSLTFKVSPMLAVFILGAASRNLDRQHFMMEIDFGWLARLFLILLFVLTGMHLQPQGLRHAILIVLGFIGARMIAKTTGIFLFLKMSRLTVRQAVCISVSLLPMAGVAIGMSTTLVDVNPILGQKLTTIISAILAILNLLAPITTQYALIKAGETKNGHG